MTTTLKDQITDLLRESGYDFFSACQWYEEAKREGLFVPGARLVVGDYSVTVAQKRRHIAP